MKETVLDVLMYLFENYQTVEFVDQANHENLQEELVAAGFEAEEVGNAFRWLDGLTQTRQLPMVFGPGHSHRMSRVSALSRATGHPVADPS